MSRRDASLVLSVILCLLSSCQKASTGVNSNTIEKAPTNVDWEAIDEKYHIVERRTVPLLYDSLSGERVIRFSGYKASITIRVDDAIEYFRKREKYPNLPLEKLLADTLQQESSIRSEYFYGDFPWREQERLRFCIAALLDEGKCVVKLLDQSKTASEIVACKYSSIIGPMNGTEGRWYFLPDGRPFYEITDVFH